MISYYLLVWTVLVTKFTYCIGYVVTNSSCGEGYPYGKCYAGYKVLRIFTPDENAMKSMDQSILKAFDVDVWSHPCVADNDTRKGYDVMVSPNDMDNLLNVVNSLQLNTNILHPDVKDVLIKEANMVKTIFCCVCLTYIHITFFFYN